METLEPFLSLLGTTAIIGIAVQYFLSSKSNARKRSYDERKEAYLGLAEAWMRQGQDGIDNRNKLEVALWKLRCDFVASPAVLKSLDAFYNSELGSSENEIAMRELKKSMRDDLQRFQ